MRKILILLTVFLCATLASAQSTKDIEKALNKTHKEEMKQLKDRYDLKSIYIKVEEDGYWYYSANRKKGKCGVLNQQGEIIVPIKYDDIDYYPPLPEGLSNPIAGDTAWHRANVACFHTMTFGDKGNRNKYGIYRLDGTVMVDDLEATLCMNTLKGYTRYLVKKEASDYDETALYTQDGECLIPMGIFYAKIKDKVCVIHKIIGEDFQNSGLLTGAIMLDGALPPVPCRYASVNYDKANNQWVVADPVTLKESVYQPGQVLTTELKDRGVELFWAKKYDETIDYYAKEGIDKPWAKYYTGAALLNKAMTMEGDIHVFIYMSQRGKMDEPIPGVGTTWRDALIGRNYDFDLLRKLYTTGFQMMEAYILEDTTFIKEVKHYTFPDLNFYLERLDREKTDFLPLWDKFVKENQAIMAQREAERQRAARQNEIMARLLGVFVESLAQRIVGGGSSHSSSYSGGTSSYVGSTTGVSSSSRSSSSSSRSTSSSAAPTQYRRCEKCRGTGDIFTTSTIGTYGNDKKTVCSVCGKEHWSSTVHHHRKCDNCNGTGKVVK